MAQPQLYIWGQTTALVNRGSAAILWKAPSPCRDGVINRPLSQFCFIEGDTVQVIALRTFVLEGNYRIVLCLEHSLVNRTREPGGKFL